MRYNNNANKYRPKAEKIESDESEEKKPKEVKLKSEMYNNDNELITKRDDVQNVNAMMWGFVIGFILFLILFIFIIIFVK